MPQILSFNLALILPMASIILCGEYRIRTDDPLLAKQVL